MLLCSYNYIIVCFTEGIVLGLKNLPWSKTNALESWGKREYIGLLDPPRNSRTLELQAAKIVSWPHLECVLITNRLYTFTDIVGTLRFESKPTADLPARHHLPLAVVAAWPCPLHRLPLSWDILQKLRTEALQKLRSKMGPMRSCTKMAGAKGLKVWGYLIYIYIDIYI